MMLSDMELSSGYFSNAYAVATLSSAFLLPLIGKWVDKLSLRILSLIGGLGLIFASFIMYQVDNLVLLIFGLFLLRFFGQGSMILIGSTAIARSFSKSRGKALSVSSLGLALAETITPLLFVLMINQNGWRSSWLITAGGTLLIFLPLTQWLITKSRRESDPDDSSTAQQPIDFTRSQVLKDWKFYLILPAFMFLPFFITGIFIHQNMLATAKGWSMEWMATCFIGYGLAKVIMSFVGGALVDRYSAKKVFSFYLFPLAIGLLLIFLSDHKIIAMFYMILVGITASLGSLTGVAVWAELYGVKNFGAIKSMVTMLMVISTALGPIVLGWGLGQSMSYTIIISVLTIVLVSSLGFVVMRLKNNVPAGVF
jgi:predicted MFS family arabinose efflux permease